MLGLCGLAWAGGGCTTSKLWEEGRFSRFHEPANPPNLIVCQSERCNDLLVEYDETCDTCNTVTRRAYWLAQNEDRVRSRRKPRFVSTDEARGLTVVPVEEHWIGPDRPAEGLHAYYSTNNVTLTVISPDGKLGDWQLPVYADSSGTLKRVFLTPPAVTADVAIVGGYIAYHALPGLGGWINH
jgi:hypothetical protein